MTTKYSQKSGDVFDGQPQDHGEQEELSDIVADQIGKQSQGDPNEYGYPKLRRHHYWGFMDGQAQILTREPDATHPANGRWEMWSDANRPAGIEAGPAERYDAANA